MSKTLSGIVMFVKEDSAVVYTGNGSWRIPLEDFENDPQKDDKVTIEADNLWFPTWLRVKSKL